MRPISDDETGLVYSSYVRSTWPRGGYGPISYSEHCPIMQSRMDALLASNPIALCVVDDEAPGWVGGWAMAHALSTGELAIHWAWVKPSHRRLGLGALLLRHVRAAAPGCTDIVATRF